MFHIRDFIKFSWRRGTDFSTKIFQIAWLCNNNKIFMCFFNDGVFSLSPLWSCKNQKRPLWFEEQKKKTVLRCESENQPPPTYLPRKGSSGEGMTEEYRNCHFVKKDWQSTSGCRNAGATHPANNLSANEDSWGRACATNHCFKRNRCPWLKDASGTSTYFWPLYVHLKSEQLNAVRSRIGYIKCKIFFKKELKQKSAQLCGMENEVSAQKRWVM